MRPPLPAFNFTHSFGAQKLGSLLEGTGGGCVWFDFNNDGLPDLYVTSGKPLEAGVHPFPLKQQPENPPHNHLYRNDGNGKFTDVTDQAGVAANIYGMAAIAADYDNDGFVDLFVTGYGRAILYRNKGDGTFKDVTAKAGIKVDGWSISSTWLDYDRDGCVDLFVGRYVKFDPKYRNYYAGDNYPGPLDYEGTTNVLYHNNCNGTFTDVSEKSGIAAFTGRTMGDAANFGRGRARPGSTPGVYPGPGREHPAQLRDPLVTDQYIGTGRIKAPLAVQVNAPLPEVALDLPTTVFGDIDIPGTATGNEFAGYSLEYGTGTNPTNWTAFYQSSTPVPSGTLFPNFSTSLLGEGTFTFRLTAETRRASERSNARPSKSTTCTSLPRTTKSAASRRQD